MFARDRYVALQESNDPSAQKETTGAALLTAQGSSSLRHIDEEWRKLSATFLTQPKTLRVIFDRLESRTDDSSLADDQFEVFCTLSDDSQERFRLNFHD